MPEAYHPDFGQVVNYQFIRLPDNSDAQVAATIRDVMYLVRKDAQSPFIREEAMRAMEMGNGNPNLGMADVEAIHAFQAGRSNCGRPRGRR